MELRDNANVRRIKTNIGTKAKMYSIHFPFLSEYMNLTEKTTKF
jgi:hypothetical protein